MSNNMRGKCKELSEEAVKKDPSLRLVRGFYYCPIWNKEEQHWWTEKMDGTIYDPTASQYPSNGHGTYRKYDGTMICEQCGTIIEEKDIIWQGRFATCSRNCALRLVGL